MNILYLLLGWLLGLLSPHISERIKRHYQKNDLRCGIVSELKEIKVRLVSTVYLLTKKIGVYDKQFIDWVKKNLEGYEGSYPTKKILSNLENLSSHANNKQLAEIQLLYCDEEGGLSLKKFYLPFLESKIELFPIFTDKFRSLIFEIRSQIQVINEEIDNAQFYFRKTFDSAMSAENHKIVRQNLKSCYENIERQVKLTVGKINDLISCKC